MRVRLNMDPCVCDTLGLPMSFFDFNCAIRSENKDGVENRWLPRYPLQPRIQRELVDNKSTLRRIRVNKKTLTHMSISCCLYKMKATRSFGD